MAKKIKVKKYNRKQAKEIHFQFAEWPTAGMLTFPAGDKLNQIKPFDPKPTLYRGGFPQPDIGLFSGGT